MSRVDRFEAVRTDDGWHGRFRASNGKVVWTTENYTRRRALTNAIVLLTWNMGGWGPTPETVEIDERTP